MTLSSLISQLRSLISYTLKQRTFSLVVSFIKKLFLVKGLLPFLQFLLNSFVRLTYESSVGRNAVQQMVCFASIDTVAIE